MNIFYSLSTLKYLVATKARSPIKFLLLGFILISISTQGQSILITDSFSCNEPAIAIDRTNPANVYMGCNRSNGGNYVGAYYSHDFGATWNKSVLNSTVVPYGDPAMVTDDSGYVYFIHDAKGSGLGISLDRLICNRSIDNGLTYTSETYIDYDSTYGHDKSFACVDLNANSLYKNNIYVGILQHKLQAFFGIVGIQRHISAPCF